MNFKFRDLIMEILQKDSRYKCHIYKKEFTQYEHSAVSRFINDDQRVKCRYNLGMTGCKTKHAKVFSTASQLLRFGIGLPENKAKHEILLRINIHCL